MRPLDQLLRVAADFCRDRGNVELARELTEAAVPQIVQIGEGGAQITWGGRTYLDSWGRLLLPSGAVDDVHWVILVDRGTLPLEADPQEIECATDGCSRARTMTGAHPDRCPRCIQIMRDEDDPRDPFTQIHIN